MLFVTVAFCYHEISMQTDVDIMYELKIQQEALADILEVTENLEGMVSKCLASVFFTH